MLTLVFTPLYHIERHKSTKAFVSETITDYRLRWKNHSTVQRYLFIRVLKKQKNFLQGVFRDKEELAQMCVTQANKITKLEQSRMDWQRKIIEAEREKRDYLERLDGEQQSHRWI